VNFKIRELQGKDRLINEENDKAVASIAQVELIHREKKEQNFKLEKEIFNLEKDIEDIIFKIDMANMEMQRRKDAIIARKNGQQPQGRESVFSNNYAVQIQQGDRKTLMRATVAPAKNGNVQQTKPYCQLI